MTYAVRGDVEARLPAVQAGGNWYAPLTVTQVDAIGEGIAAEIDATLAGCGFSTPVTTPASAVTYLTTVNVWGWAAEIQRARYRNPDAANKESAWSFYEDRYQEALKGLCAWAEGALAQGGTSLPASFTTVFPDAVDEPEWTDNEQIVFGDRVRF